MCRINVTGSTRRAPAQVFLSVANNRRPETSAAADLMKRKKFSTRTQHDLPVARGQVSSEAMSPQKLKAPSPMLTLTCPSLMSGAPVWQLHCARARVGEMNRPNADDTVSRGRLGRSRIPWEGLGALARPEPVYCHRSGIANTVLVQQMPSQRRFTSRGADRSTGFQEGAIVCLRSQLCAHLQSRLQ
jgi:hypothetical protein